MHANRTFSSWVAAVSTAALLLSACGGSNTASAPTTGAAGAAATKPASAAPAGAATTAMTPTTAAAAPTTAATTAATSAATTAATAAATIAATAAATTAATAGATAAATTASTTTGSATAAATTAANTTTTTAAGSGTVKIGVDLPMSGSEAANGVPTLNGIKLAVDQANKKGGVAGFKIEVVSLDDAVNGLHDPAQGAKNVQQLISDNAVLAMVGPFNSNVAKAQIPLTNAAGLAQISMANTNESLTKPEFGALDLRKTNPDKIAYFRVCTTDDIQGPAGADYAAKNLKLMKAFIIDDNETYGKGIADNWEKQFKADGGNVLGHEHITKGQQDFTAVLTKAKGTNPDIIYYGGVSQNGGGLMKKQMKSVALNIPFMGGDGIVEENFIAQAGDNADNAYGTVAAVNAETLPEAKEFLDTYKAAYNTAVGPYSANAFEATNIIIAAIDRAAKASGGKMPTREQVRQEVANTKDFKGVIGTTSFDKNGDTTNRWISIHTTKGGKWTFLDQIKFGS